MDATQHLPCRFCTTDNLTWMHKIADNTTANLALHLTHIAHGGFSKSACNFCVTQYVKYTLRRAPHPNSRRCVTLPPLYLPPDPQSGLLPTTTTSTTLGTPRGKLSQRWMIVWLCKRDHDELALNYYEGPSNKGCLPVNISLLEKATHPHIPWNLRLIRLSWHLGSFQTPKHSWNLQV